MTYFTVRPYLSTSSITSSTKNGNCPLETFLILSMLSGFASMQHISKTINVDDIILFISGKTEKFKHFLDVK